MLLRAVLFLLATATVATKDSEVQEHSHNTIRGGQGSSSAAKPSALLHDNRDDKEQRRLGKINGGYHRVNQSSIEVAWTLNTLNKTLPPELNVINGDDDDNEESDTGFGVGDPIQEEDGDDFYIVDPNHTVATTAWGSDATNTTIAQTTTVPTIMPTLSPTEPPTRNPAAVTFIGDGGGLHFPLQQCQGGKNGL